MATFGEKKLKQIELLKALGEKHKGPEGSTRGLANHQLTELELYFDSFKRESSQASVRVPYYKWCIEQLSNGKQINYGHLTRKILEENPGLMYIR